MFIVEVKHNNIGKVAIEFDHQPQQSLADIKIKNHRGITCCKITLLDAEGKTDYERIIGYNHAICGCKDNFCRKEGRRVALLKTVAPMPKEVRKEVLQGYFAQRRYAGDF